MKNRQTAIDLMSLLSRELFGTEIDDNDALYSKDVYWLAGGQRMLAYLYDVKDKFEEGAETIDTTAKTSAKRTLRLAQIARYLTEALAKEGIAAAIIKGIDLASDSPIPELRASTDIDIMLGNGDDVTKAVEILENHGCRVDDKQDSKHHVALRFEETFEIELHVRAVRSFDNEEVNRRIDEIFTFTKEEIEYKEVFGMTFPVLPRAKSGLYNLIHILQHYMNSGFGISHVCDFAMFMFRNGDSKDMEEYKKYIEYLGLSGFSNLMCNVCYLYLKLPLEKLPYTDIENNLDLYKLSDDSIMEEMLKEIFDNGKYGKGDKNRVVNVQKASATGMFAEFHHQMKENFPKASRLFISWPVLWIATLVIFMRNNRKVRNTSTIAVLKSSMKRGKVTDKLKLWDGVK